MSKLKIFIIISILLVGLVSGCTNKTNPTPEQLCKANVEEHAEDFLTGPEIPHEFEVLAVGSFSSFEKAQIFMENNRITEIRINKIKSDFIGVKQPVIIMRVVSTLFEIVWNLDFAVVCNEAGTEIMPASKS